ncbi:hypothetical protein FW774_19165 [Pedobacter sp. BS3]|uniref:hypothetical protein n=1 Tax=Pedobacter sp. BS3 TaxID=2567937 RepID=UPI0011EE3B38|nr:hypothetical protein [Pedobacter sp. BS3]TZF81172.1 hypothetical protein FW774_19165 [Pedobacter sp. BS3]
MQPTITKFFGSNKIATLCCVADNAVPHCFNCFYAFDEQHHLLFFKSSDDSYHSKILADNHKVAGTILPAKISLPLIKGLQFSGTILCSSLPPVHPDSFYHKIYPLAVARAGKVWCVQLDSVKMTDNTPVFGGKTYWQRQLHHR